MPPGAVRNPYPDVVEVAGQGYEKGRHAGAENHAGLCPGRESAARSRSADRSRRPRSECTVLVASFTNSGRRLAAADDHAVQEPQRSEIQYASQTRDEHGERLQGQ